MKHLLFTCIFLSGVLLSSAQNLKPTAGSTSLEVQFSPLSGNPIALDGGIRFRMFSTETSALRGTVFLGGSSSTDKSNAFESNGDIAELKDKESSFNLQLRPGMEWHLAGTERLSPYYGGEGIIGFGNTSSTSEMLDFEDKIQELKVTQSSFSIGINAVGGMDYYFAKNIFLGAEIGAGIVYQSMGKETSSSSVSGADDVETPGGSSLTGGPNVNGRIRLGITF